MAATTEIRSRLIEADNMLSAAAHGAAVVVDAYETIDHEDAVFLQQIAELLVFTPKHRHL